MSISLRDFQRVAVTDVKSAFKGELNERITPRDGFAGRARLVLFVLPTGGGKCLAKGTPVTMYDGSVKPVESIIVGDLVMGPDSQPRKVESLANGSEEMYRVTPVKGEPYTVNESHILSLKITGTYNVTGGDGKKYAPGDICNISVLDYIKSSKTFKHVAKGWRTSVDFPNPTNSFIVPPYILGCWLGDGTLGYKKAEITNADSEIIHEWAKWGKEIGCILKVDSQKHTKCNMYRLIGKDNNGRAGGGNPALNKLRAAGVHERRHIPAEYKTASRKDRLELLAGLLDTDGYLHHGYFEIVNKSSRMAQDIAFLARSLGFACTVKHVQKTCTNTNSTNWYWKLGISGHVDEIPCKVPRRKALPRRQKKDVLHTGISVEPVGIGEYHGFELSGPDRLFLLGDFTVTHNTYTFSYITEGAARKNNRVLIIAHRKSLVEQASLSLAKLGVFHDVLLPKAKRSSIIRAHNDQLGRPYIRTGAHVVVASVQSLARRIEWLQDFNPALLIPDEAHHAVAGTWKRIIEALPRTRVLGVTATPTRTDGCGLGDVFEVMVEGPSPKWMVEQGYLVPARVFRPPLSKEAAEAMDSVRIKGGDLDAEAQAAILDNAQITGDVIKHYTDLCPGRPAIVFCASVRHARHVTERFCEAGYKFELIIGDMDGLDQDRALQGLATGRLHGVVSVDVISEGTDVPVAEVAILLRKTQSEGLYLQQVGRVLRPVFADGYDLNCAEGRLSAIANSDKPYGLVLDHVGNSLIHGLPTSERVWSLDAEKRSKRKKDEDDEDDVKTLQCPDCYMVHEPAPVCPACGYKYEMKAWKPPTESGGQLQEVTENQADLDRIAARRAQGKARDVESLMAQGVSIHRAKHIIAAREQKAKLQAELKRVCDQFIDNGGDLNEIGFSAGDIKTMKPKQLETEIDRIGGLMWGVGRA